MATFVLGSNSKFPVGTSVKAYPRSNFPSTAPISGTPLGVQTSSATVAADGTTTFTGLADGTAYVANALVASVEEYVSFSTPVAAQSGIPATVVDAKGDLIVATADDTVARRAVGANGTVLTADSAEATGVKWAAAAGGGYGAPLVSGKHSALWYAVPVRSGDLGANNPAVGTMQATPLALPSCTLQAIAVRVTTAVGGSLIRLGIYSDDGTGYPAALLIDAGQVSGAATGTVAATISQAVTGGLVWLVAVNQTGTPTMQSMANVAAHPIAVGAATALAAIAVAPAPSGYSQTGVTGALPASFSTTVTPIDTPVRLAVQAAT